MCGICCILDFCRFTLSTKKCNDCINHENTRLYKRGPDRSAVTHVEVADCARLTFNGHVLHLRGDHVVAQPAEDTHGNILLWNGEIFDGIQVGDDESDTDILLRCLSRSQCEVDILSVMSQVQGPWAFIYWQASCDTLWFGRDVFGRRSLLWHLPESDTDQFILSSVLIKPFSFTEIPSVGIYKLVLKSQPEGSLSAPEISLFPWQQAVWPGSLDPVCDKTFQNKITEGMRASVAAFHLREDRQVPSQMPSLNKQIPDTDTVLSPLEDGTTSLEYLQTLLSTNGYLATLSRQLSQVLLEAVKTRVFNQHRKPRQQAEVMLANDSIVNRSVDGSHNSHSAPSHTASVHGAPADRVSTDMAACSLASEPTVSPAHVAILFSGGIDSTVLAALADRCVPKEEPIDLINVAFEQREKKVDKKHRHQDQPTASRGWDVPDRLTGYVALSELNPDRQWNFIEVNVTAAELQETREQHIRDLLYPLVTVLDDSIGCAIWFAARGRGTLGNGTRKGQPVHSRARVILCGMGADEQLAGYSRHRVRFKTEGWEGLVKEIELELTRLSARNLGRDDRIITDHGKESRFPFLDERVVKFLCSLPIQDKANLSLPRGLGEKLLLRLSAVELGLYQTAALPKRAIQFGSRIAKLENSKENASDKCDRLAKAKS